MSDNYKLQKEMVKNWPDTVCIHTDGACRGNPGVSSIGLAVFDLTGHTVYEEAQLLPGEHTNNFAEYKAVARALELGLQKKVHTLILKSDSQLVINQLSGLYKVKSPNIKPLFKTCQKLAESIPCVKYKHIPRTQNTKADKLANLILDLQ